MSDNQPQNLVNAELGNSIIRRPKIRPSGVSRYKNPLEEAFKSSTRKQIDDRITTVIQTLNNSSDTSTASFASTFLAF
ncbi:16550_t:CDS:2 [Funneliformis geosporum]|nr:16550_t:CDS:2 [Funneliformis geosporum]